MRLPASAAALAAALAAGCTSPQPCPSPLEECSGQCVDVQSDRLHCGSCGQSCGAGEGCLAGACGADAAAPCAVRTGGAFVTLGACGTAVKLWIANGEFVAKAASRVGQPPQEVPVLGLEAGADCDVQWSWHANPASARFDPAAPSASCDVCPAAIEANVAFYVSVGSWCPSAARVLAVDDRGAP